MLFGGKDRDPDFPRRFRGQALPSMLASFGWSGYFSFPGEN